MQRLFARVFKKLAPGLPEIPLVALSKSNAVPVEHVAQEIDSVAFDREHLRVRFDLKRVSAVVADTEFHQLF